MTKQEISNVLNQNAQQRSGIVNGIEFGVDQGPFESSSSKYVAYILGNYNGDFFFDTLEEFLNGFCVNETPIGQLLSNITSFTVDNCDN